jgi:hypothetical protein
MAYDLRIQGSAGLYRIVAATPSGKQWRKRNLGKGERSVLPNGALVCDSSADCRAIVAGAVKDGLAVEVNGVDMKGFGQ